MASQIITLPRPVFKTLFSRGIGLQMLLWQAGLDMPYTWYQPNHPSVAIRASVAQFNLGSRVMFRDGVLALALVTEGVQPKFWPRPFPDDVTLRLLDALEAILCSVVSLSAHQVLQLAAAFECARDLPAIGQEPLALRHPHTARMRRLRAQGLTLSQDFAARLGEIDREVGTYADRLSVLDLEQCIATLSSQAELGIRLRLRSGGESKDPCLDLLTATRRSSLEGLMNTVADLADATRYALERWASFSGIYDSGPSTSDIGYLNTVATGNTWNDDTDPWRDEESPDLGLGAAHQFKSPVPAQSVISSVDRWVDEFDRRRWVGAHPLVWGAMAHLEFIRITPFRRANRRSARVLFQAMLYGAGWPVLPWEIGFERHHDEYLDALRRSFATRSYRPIVAFILQICESALAHGGHMHDVLPGQRARLEAAIAGPEFAGTSARDYADALLGEVLVEGFGWGLRNDRNLLKRLTAEGYMDCIRTPVGAVFSSPIARTLLRRNDAS